VTGIIHGELFAVVIILLCAAIMARGGWVWSTTSFRGAR